MSFFALSNNKRWCFGLFHSFSCCFNTIKQLLSMIKIRGRLFMRIRENCFCIYNFLVVSAQVIEISRLYISLFSLFHFLLDSHMIIWLSFPISSYVTSCSHYFHCRPLHLNWFKDIIISYSNQCKKWANYAIDKNIGWWSV